MSKWRRFLISFGLVRATEAEHIEMCPWCRAAIKREKEKPPTSCTVCDGAGCPDCCQECEGKGCAKCEKEKQ